jgi:iron complex transport system ATP-binding protein
VAHEVVTEERLRALYDIDFDIVRNARGCVCNYFTPTGA